MSKIEAVQEEISRPIGDDVERSPCADGGSDHLESSSFACQAQLEELEAFLARRGLRAVMDPGAMPGDPAELIRKADGEVVDASKASDDVSAAAHLWALLIDLRDGSVSETEFENHGGDACLQLLSLPPRREGFREQSWSQPRLRM